MERQILHVDVNNAFLSWTAIDMLKNGSNIDIREIPAVIGGDESKRSGIVLAKSIKAKECGVKSILLDIEGGYYRKHKNSIPESIYELFEYTKDRAKEFDLYFLVFDHASQMLSENNNYLSEYYFFKDITQHKIKECITKNIENRNKSLLNKLLGKLNL